MHLCLHFVRDRLRTEVPLIRIQCVVDVLSVHFSQRFMLLLHIGLDVLLDLTELSLHPQRLILDRVEHPLVARVSGQLRL